MSDQNIKCTKKVASGIDMKRLLSAIACIVATFQLHAAQVMMAASALTGKVTDPRGYLGN
jgi:hypothetical protein